MNKSYVFKITNNTLYINKYNNKTNKNDLVFSLSYIKDNYDLVTTVLNSKINSKVNTCVINIKDDLLLIIKLINEFPSIKKITFSKNVTINGIVYSAINRNTNIESIECYKLDKNALKVLNKNAKCYIRNKYIGIRNLSLIATFLIIISSAVFLNFMYYEYKEYKNVNESTNEVIGIRNDYTIKISNIEGNNENNNDDYIDYSKVFDKLSKINSDTVGWIKINNTKIDYPVVQYTDNDYYLNHDFNKEKNSKGWIFMDSRNKSNTLDNNTIIYGHNIVSSGIMYADITKLFSKSFYENNNNYITFNTKKQNMKWKIFSVYKTSDNTTYLRNNFNTQQEFSDFVNKVKRQSEIDFNTNISVGSNTKILTLSTCRSDNSRYVVHAILE